MKANVVKRRSIDNVTFDWGVNLFLIVVLLLTIIPLWYVAMTPPKSRHWSG